MPRLGPDNMPVFSTVGEMLKYLRRRAHLTQRELAVASGYSVPHISHLENDQQLLDQATLLARFVPALGLQDEPELVEQLLALAADACIDEQEYDQAMPSGLQMRGNLPSVLTSFVGRETELAEIANLLDDPACRLLTLIGPGGIGKTRLAVEAIERQTARTAEVACFVSLAPLTTVESVAPAIAAAVGLSLLPDAEPCQQLLSYLAGQRILLILDNFEHLLAATALVADILRTAPGVKMLVTSRERLNVQGEWVRTIEGMTFPGSEETADIEQFAAVQLFVARARQVQKDFFWANEPSHLIRICQLLGGMPLGLLLAASWVDTLTLAEIAQEIAQSLDILETTMRDVPERQRSVRAAFDHSWKMLSETERTVFCRLSIFRGGFTREAAQAVAGASLRVLATLISKSLLRHVPTGRYSLHELLRQYGADRLCTLGFLSDTCAAHARYYLDFLHEREVDIKGRRQAAALEEIQTDFENIRLAWQWAVDQRQYEAISRSVDCLTLAAEMTNVLPDVRELLQLAVTSLAPNSDEPPTRSGRRLSSATNG